MAPAFPRIQAAAIDGRQHVIFHRQVELERLCEVLIDKVDEIKQAIATDYGHSPAEIAFEYHAALTALKRDYASLDQKKAHEQEYLVSHGKNDTKRRAPVGIVYIEPTSHTLFYSVIAPLSAALAAGNCVIALIEKNLRAVTRLLREILPKALSADVFAISSNPINNATVLDRCVSVLQNGVKGQPRVNQLATFQDSIAIAIVDRTADVNLAAHEILATRAQFSGRSPYAPSIVLVNEFVKEAFLRAADEIASSQKDSNPSEKRFIGSKVDAALQRLRKIDPQLEVASSHSNVATVEIGRRSPIIGTRVEGPVFVVQSIKSLDDAIDLLDSDSAEPYLAAYHFATPSTANYLSRYIPAQQSFINHTPRALLVGPALPFAQPSTVENRYPRELFTVPCPVLIEPTTGSGGSRSAEAVLKGESAQKLIDQATTPLKAFKRHPGGGVGFFEQGFLINAGLIVASTLTVSATGLIWFWRWSRAV